MQRFLIRWILMPIVMIAVGMGAMAALMSSFGSAEIQRDSSEVVTAVTREEQVALMGVAVQGIEKITAENNKVWGVPIPGTFRESLIQYEFTAKLGIDGKNVTIEEVGEDTFRIAVPEFIVIGYEVGDFYTVVERSGVLSFVKERIDGANVSSEILSKERDEYVEKNLDLLKDQTKFFYTSIIRSVDPQIELEFVFAEDQE